MQFLGPKYTLISQLPLLQRLESCYFLELFKKKIVFVLKSFNCFRKFYTWAQKCLDILETCKPSKVRDGLKPLYILITCL